MDSPDSGLHYEYVLEVVSWGAKYYIKYDDYADSLNYYSNISSGMRGKGMDDEKSH